MPNISRVTTLQLFHRFPRFVILLEWNILWHCCIASSSHVHFRWNFNNSRFFGCPEYADLICIWTVGNVTNDGKEHPLLTFDGPPLNLSIHFWSLFWFTLLPQLWTRFQLLCCRPPTPTTIIALQIFFCGGSKFCKYSFNVSRYWLPACRS